MRKSVAKKQFCFQVSEQLGALETPWSLTTKRIKRWELGSFWTHTFTPPGQHCLCLLSRFRFLWLFCVCRLDAGGLYIFWLQTQNSEGQQLYRAIYTGIQGLVTAELNLKGIHKRAVIISVSTAGTCKQVLLQLWLPLTPPTPLKKKREMYVQLGFFFFNTGGGLISPVFLLEMKLETITAAQAFLCMSVCFRCERVWHSAGAVWLKCWLCEPLWFILVPL